MKIGTAEVKTTKVSPDTGLFPLPDDMYWEVVKNGDIRGSYYWNKGVPGDFLVLRLMKTVTTFVGEEPKTFWQALTSRHTRKTDTEELLMMQEGLWERGIDVSVGSSIAYLKGDGWVRASNCYVRQLDLTPELLANISREVWINYLTGLHYQALGINASMTREAESNKWVGKYPPKNVKDIH